MSEKSIMFLLAFLSFLIAAILIWLGYVTGLNPGWAALAGVLCLLFFGAGMLADD